MLPKALENRARIARFVQDALSAQDQRSPEERKAHGEDLRKKVPHAAQGTWVAPNNRPDPVELLFSQDASRTPDLVPLRHERMSSSAFAFYRGAALVMASDLSLTPSTGINVQACGDAHIANFGMFRSPEGRIVFDINDFDETARGPWEWDLKRLAASIEICARSRHFSQEESERAVRYCVRAYRRSMLNFATMGHLDVWYDQLDLNELSGQLSYEVSEEQQQEISAMFMSVKEKGRTKALTKLTEVVDGQLRFKSNPPLLVPLSALLADSSSASFGDSARIETIIETALTQYRQTLPPDTRQVVSLYRGIDAAQKVVGVGSVGTVSLAILLRGANDDDALILQVKEVQESVLERFCGEDCHIQHGQRVAEGQRALQSTSDPLLGWCRIPLGNKGVKDFYVRQLWNNKGSIDLTTIEAEQLAVLASVCGWHLSHAHARTGDRFGIAGYLGENDAFDEALVAFARSYADQNEADFQHFVQAVSAKQ